MPNHRRRQAPGLRASLAGVAAGMALLVASPLQARQEAAGHPGSDPPASPVVVSPAADSAARTLDASIGDGQAPSDHLSADSLRSLTERATRLADRGEHAAAGGLLEAAARGRPEIASWLRLSALQQAARAGLPAWARVLAASLRVDPVVPSDSVSLELARAVFEAAAPADSTTSADLVAVAAAFDAQWDPALWTEQAGPILLQVGDTAAAIAGYRRALQAPGFPSEAGDALLALDDGWRTRRQVGLAERREGRFDHAAALLADAEARAPAPERPRLALELARTRLDGGLSGVSRAAAPWAGRKGTEDSVRAALELAIGTDDLRRGRRTGAEAAFRRAAAGSGAAAARASYLMADLAHDRRHLSSMHRWLERTARRFPRSEYGGLAIMRLGFASFLAGDYRTAASRFRAYRARHARGSWSSASIYWEARARLASGDSSAADALFGRVAATDPAGYYGLRAADRLGNGSLYGVEPDTLPPPPDDWTSRADLLVARMGLLRELGWRTRAEVELDARRETLVTDDVDRLALAHRLERSGWAGPAIGMAWSAFAARGGKWDESLLKAIFPLPYRDTIVAAARQVQVDPALLAAVVRQESAFDPEVVSSAGAIGLTQLMPATARRVARRSGLPVPDSADLYDPGVNIEIGARYLSELLQRYEGSRLAALVAYNAGPTRWSRWRRLPEHASDAELFVEAIPFAETRRYVKAVLRNELLYRKLHDLEAAGHAARAGASADTARGAG